MKGNFDFLKAKKEFRSFAQACIDAENSMSVSPATTAILCRRALELAVKWVYSFDTELKLPYKDNLSSLVNNNSFKYMIDSEMYHFLVYIIRTGNLSVHTNKYVRREEAILALRNLHQFVSWIDYCYADEYTATEFDESIIPKGGNKRTSPEELNKLYEKLSSKDKKIEEIIAENQSLRQKLTEKRIENTKNYDFKVEHISEYETRKRFIDVELKLAGWEFNTRDIVEEEKVEGMPNGSGIGYADYVLYGDNGKPLAVIEAKKASVTPDKGQHQAKLYADCLEKKYNQRPIIFTTNGFETYIWDDAVGYPMRRVSGFLKKDELQLRVDRRSTRKPFDYKTINDEITNRYYQKEAIIAVCEAFDKKQRKCLIVAGTGTGKTRISVSLVDMLTRHNFAKNVLFLADRKELVKQAKNSFSKLLPDLPLCNLLDKSEDPESARMIFSTYPTMMNAIDETKSKDGKILFTPGHFDLIIVDESHRSIYKKYKTIFEYFDANLLGLTATPKDEIDKNTYTVFELESGVPTYAYEYEQAVEDGYLVDYRTIEVKTKIMENGIKYDQLSDEEKEQYEDTFDDDERIDKEISNTAINKWLFNADTIDLVLSKLMEEGLKIEGGNILGKTIIFAKSHRHAVAIVDRFNTIYPQYGGKFAQVVDYDTKYVDNIIDNFKQKDKLPQIAVSVDMLDTGIDVPEILNLVFFKKVKSKTKFWQMIGRGTRLCKDLLGLGLDKDKFLIFDYCSNFDFFRENPKGYESKIVLSLDERLFNLKVDIIKELQDIKYSDEEYVEYRKVLSESIYQQIKALPDESYRVRLNAKYVNKYKNQDSLKVLGAIESKELKDEISPLITTFGEDELAKRFDFVMYTIEFAKLSETNASRGIKSVISTANQLAKLGTIPQVKAQKCIIDKVRNEDFWEDVGINDLEEVREAMRELIQYIEPDITRIYYTQFEDMIVTEASNGAMYDINDLKNYKQKVEHYLKEHTDDMVIYKLRNNKKITKQDLQTLEDIMWNQLGTASDYEKEFGDMPLGKLVRKIVGLDRQAANEAFSEFLNSETLNSTQIHFVKLIVDYIVKNGFVEDNRIFMEDPFRSVGNITQLFKNNMDDARKILDIIGNIKKNSEELTEEAF